MLKGVPVLQASNHGVGFNQEMGHAALLMPNASCGIEVTFVGIRFRAAASRGQITKTHMIYAILHCWTDYSERYNTANAV